MFDLLLACVLLFPVPKPQETVIRLTVVTIVGLIGTLSTGFLGMNLLAEADAPLIQRAAIFVVTVVVALAVTALCVAKSKRLSDVLDLLSDERLGWRAKFGAFWSGRHDV